MTPGSQKAQRLDLDRAIDHVASQLSYVEADAAFAERIVSSLPERRRGWWAFAPALASLAAIAIAVVVLRPFYGGSTEVLRTERTASPNAPPSVVASAVVEPSQNRPPVVERTQKPRRTFAEPSRPDHERSLPPIESLAALSVDPVPPPVLATEEPLTVAPLTIETLALDNLPQR